MKETTRCSNAVFQVIPNLFRKSGKKRKEMENPTIGMVKVVDKSLNWKDKTKVQVGSPMKIARGLKDFPVTSENAQLLVSDLSNVCKTAGKMLERKGERRKVQVEGV